MTGMETTTTTGINPRLLIWARKRIGLTVEEVEKLSEALEDEFGSITSNRLMELESGSGQPELEELETLAEIYVCPVGYFFLVDPPVEEPSLSFRGLSPEKEGKLKPLSQQTLHRFLQLVEWTSGLIKKGVYEWKASISQLDHAQANPRDISTIVQSERAKLGFNDKVRESWVGGEEAFQWWRRQIEEQGVFCFQMKLGIDDIRGASLWYESAYPFILVNHFDVESWAGRLFTLLHEYAHIISGNEGLVCDFRGLNAGRNPEPFANRFAARMLLSHEELLKRLEELNAKSYRDTWPDALLDEIRRPLFVSRDVVAISLQEVDLAPRNLYAAKRALWEKKKPFGKGGKGKHPTNNELKLREIGYSLTKMLSASGERGAIPTFDLSSVLGMKVEKVPKFLEWARLPESLRKML